MPIPTLTVIDHPLVQHKLTLLRRRETPTARFHEVMREVSQLMGYELDARPSPGGPPGWKRRWPVSTRRC
ncbi:protein of unknown function (plasmid) [Azospirillum baldaniorum]|uniref:Phosphoribosyltransferase domain-containing protein n=1 Tax=Azospirillum baldaniorum TaxID=1064539 RepID=A0A9P1K151_9PROT|nr:protein of unknown function [Azospirillum baldaniorum]